MEWIEQACVLVTLPGLLIKPAELHIEDRSLPLAEPVIRSVDKVTVEPLSRHTPAIVHGPGLSLERVIL